MDKEELINPCVGCNDEIPCETCVARRVYKQAVKEQEIVKSRDNEWNQILNKISRDIRRILDDDSISDIARWVKIANYIRRFENGRS